MYCLRTSTVFWPGRFCQLLSFVFLFVLFFCEAHHYCFLFFFNVAYIHPITMHSLTHTYLFAWLYSCHVHCIWGYWIMDRAHDSFIEYQGFIHTHKQITLKKSLEEVWERYQKVGAEEKREVRGPIDNNYSLNAGVKLTITVSLSALFSRVSFCLTNVLHCLAQQQDFLLMFLMLQIIIPSWGKLCFYMYFWIILKLGFIFSLVSAKVIWCTTTWNFELLSFESLFLRCIITINVSLCLVFTTSIY